MPPSEPADVPSDELLRRGRRAGEAREWGTAHELLTAADSLDLLGATDLERLAFACYMVGREDEMVAHLERAHQLHLEAGATLPAARNAIWIGIDLALRGEAGPASGWFGRAARLVDRHGSPCVEAGYLLIPKSLGAAADGRYEQAAAAAQAAVKIGLEFDDPELVAIAMHDQGRALVRLGRVDEGLRLLDEAMVSVLADGLQPIVSGIIYCSVIEGCYEVQELRRAHSWTEALSQWCGQQADLVAFTGQCLTHRAELMQLRGEWDEALREAERAATQFERSANQHPAAKAYYRQGELHRLRGNLDQADTAYRRANQSGWSPLPGLALLLEARGQGTAALRALQTHLGETSGRVERALLLPALVDVALAMGDVAAATDAAAELSEIAATYAGTMIAAAELVTRGKMHLASGQLGEAVTTLRRACAAWGEFDAPYEVAQARARLAEAYRALGDEESANLEAEAAMTIFTELGAERDLARLTPRVPAAPNSIITEREREVLRLVTDGKTNKQIAEELFISRRTVDRHLSNILTKLGVTSRTAAAAQAMERGLV